MKLSVIGIEPAMDEKKKGEFIIVNFQTVMTKKEFKKFLDKQNLWGIDTNGD